MSNSLIILLALISINIMFIIAMASMYQWYKWKRIAFILKGHCEALIESSKTVNKEVRSYLKIENK